MRQLSFCAMISFFVGVGMVGSEAQAVVTLSVASSTNPNALPVGQLVTFQVQLSGLTSGQELDFLAATVNYNSALLGTPTIVKGGIIPNPLADPLDFTPSPAAGQADASFSTFSASSADHIRNNGVFYSFSTQVLMAGEGSLSFSLADASRFPNIPEDVTMGQALSFRSVIVPEPSTWVLLIAASLTAAAYFVMRRRSAAFVR